MFSAQRESIKSAMGFRVQVTRGREVFIGRLVPPLPRSAGVVAYMVLEKNGAIPVLKTDEFLVVDRFGSDNPLVDVVFRWFEKEVLALFPACPSDYKGVLCDSYTIRDGHGGCNYALITQRSRPATLEEYGETRKVLEEHYEYRLRVLRRASYWHHDARHKEALRLRKLVKGTLGEPWIPNW